MSVTANALPYDEFVKGLRGPGQQWKIFANLSAEIVNTGLCMFCGGCIAACPVNILYPTPDEKPTMKGRCILCGLCYYSCPRVELPLKTIEHGLFGRDRMENETIIGVHSGVWSVRSAEKEVLKVCQDGGVVTTLLRHALKSKIVDRVVTVATESENPWRPKPVVINNPDDLLSAARSKYTATGSIRALADAIFEHYDPHITGGATNDLDPKLAFVGVPCQIQAIRRMYTRGNSKLTEHISLAIGLFCYNTYRYAGLIQEFASKQQSVEPSQITKMECKEGVFRAYQNNAVRIEAHLKELEPFILPGCSKCQDFTAELADLSVGHVGAEEGWCTVIVRTQKGADLLKEASAAGLIQSKPVSSGDLGLDHVIRLSEKKKKREAPYIRD